jgi:hypothetical protein
MPKNQKRFWQQLPTGDVADLIDSGEWLHTLRDKTIYMYFNSWILNNVS